MILLLTGVVTMCLVSSSVGQTFNPYMLQLYGGEFMENLGENWAYYMITSLSSRLTALETNIRTGAVGGCESGIVGPFDNNVRSFPIRYQGQFLAPPAVNLAVHDITQADATQPISFQIRPSGITATGLTINYNPAATFIGSVFVSYMICPYNGSPAV